MPAISEIAAVSIFLETVYPTVEGFSRQAFVAYAADLFPGQRLVKFTSLQDVTDAGVPTYHPVYDAAVAIFSQRPRPADFVLGVRALPPTQVIKLTPLITTVGYVYAFTAVGSGGVEIAVEYTVQTGDDAADICDAFASQLAALPSNTAVSALGVLTSTDSAGLLTRFKDLPPLDELKVENTSTDPGIATDLAAIAKAAEKSPDLSFFALSLDSSSEAEVNAARAWVEATKFVAAFRTTDSLVADSGTSTDVGSDAVAAASARSWLLFSQAATHDYIDAAALAAYLSANVPEGSAGPAYKTLRGITRSKLTAAQDSAIRAKMVTTYTTVKGVNVTFEGHTPDGDWFDTTVNATILEARLQEAFFGVVVNAKKLPFTQKGIDAAIGAAQAVLNTAVDNGMLSPENDAGDPPTVHRILRKDLTAAQRAARTLPNIRVTADLAGAIHRASFLVYLGA